MFSFLCNHFLLSLFSFWHPYDSDVDTFKVVQEVPKPRVCVPALNSHLRVLSRTKTKVVGLLRASGVGMVGLWCAQLNSESKQTNKTFAFLKTCVCVCVSIYNRAYFKNQSEQKLKNGKTLVTFE